MDYTWIPYYKEFAEKLMTYRNDRSSLLTLIYKYCLFLISLDTFLFYKLVH